MRRLALILIFALCASFAYAQDASDPLTLITDIYKSYTAENDMPPIRHLQHTLASAG
jgi:hypothetical protein